MRMRVFVLLMLATVLGAQTTQRRLVAEERRIQDARAELERRAKAIKPTADELKWQKIPWILDLAEGQRLAREEHRPIFLWASGDDPLHRC